MLGGKSDNLTHLAKAGFNVPPFFTLSHQEVLDLQNSSDCKKFLKKLKKWRSKHNIDACAVRSSATSEDTIENSFAGQFLTILKLSNDEDILKSIKSVANSRPKIKTRDDFEVNVIVQEMIDADVAGVLFTSDPTSGERITVVNARFGLGDSVVEGEDSDHFTIDESQHVETVYIADTKPSLERKQLIELASLGQKIKELFGSDQDIEWAIKNNRVFVLQARPITARPRLYVWDSNNISESYPGITLPLTISVARKAYSAVYRSQARLSGISAEKIQRNNHVFESLLGVFNGKLYYNLDSWYSYMTLFPNNTTNQKFFDDMIATSGETVHKNTAKHSIWFRLRYTLRLLHRLPLFEREIRLFYVFAENELDLISRKDCSSLETALARHQSLEENLLPHWGVTVDNDFLLMVYNGLLDRLLNRWLPEKNIIKTHLLANIQNIESVEQAKELLRIAQTIKKNRKINQLIITSQYQKAWQAIQGTKLQKRIEHYRSRFGNRYALDLKLEVPNPTVNPLGLMELLKPYLQLPINDKKSLERSQLNYMKASKEIEKELSLIKRVVYKKVLSKVRQYIKHREKMRLMRSKAFQISRESFEAIGSQLQERKIIDTQEDVFYLEIDEIAQYIHGSLTISDLKPLIKVRKDAYTSYTKAAMPERFTTIGLPKADHSYAKKAPKIDKKGQDLTGIISLTGHISGSVTIMKDPVIPKEPIDILVVEHTDPGWTPIIALAKGLIVEKGGVLSHAAIISRELGIPSIINVKNACQLLRTGDRVELDAHRGIITIEKK